MTQAYQYPQSNMRAEQFKLDVWHGLAQQKKVLSHDWALDQHGMNLLARLYQQPEYYAARVEAAILADYAQDIAVEVGHHALVVEYGCEHWLRTTALLDQLLKPQAYVGVCASIETRNSYQIELQYRYRKLPVELLDGSLQEPLPRNWHGHGNCVIYIPGSMLGRITHQQALNVMRQVRSFGAKLLVGIDLVKDAEVLEAAYNDRSHLQQALNLNILKRANRELAADFDVNGYYHKASYNRITHSVESYLVSLATQKVSVAGQQFKLSIAEPIFTGAHRKFSLPDMESMADAADWQLQRTWMDDKRWFALQLFH
ncbi:L-histidine N(alpha)-methyltransferase [Salinibius halmophilus]|uniref:L-histidine N(alpha)-methyltransferase n=1 Tax=Salinibius halmophilus TaxID=1853216 RepID=UPI000E66EB86|nr:L-histidine N(alpha)-methyltransferase [Salinibius halmophilus]